MQGNWLRKSTDNSATIVFVHGILSSGEQCWQSSNGAYWPDLIRDEPDLHSLGIYVYTYQTSLTSGSYSISNVVDDLKEHLFNLDDVAINTKIIFVCHSMGGIVVRKLIVERFNDILDNNIEISLFLVASPSLGSEYANWLEPIAKFAGHAQANALKFSQDNQWLNDLDKTFLNLKESKRLVIRGKELLEDKFITLKAIFRTQVVKPFSGARYFGESFKVSGTDHSTIAKPENSKSIQHRLLCNFIKEIIEKRPVIIDVNQEKQHTGTDFVESYLEKKLDDALSSFSSQPRVWVDPILSTTTEVDRGPETANRINLLDIITNPKSTKIKAPPQFGLSCLSHYLVLEAWRKNNKAFWLYLDSTNLKPHTNLIEKSTNSELKLLVCHLEDIKCVILDSWTGQNDDSIKLLQKVCDFFPNLPVIVMNTLDDSQLINIPKTETLNREFEVLYLWSLSRSLSENRTFS